MPPARCLSACAQAFRVAALMHRWTGIIFLGRVTPDFQLLSPVFRYRYQFRPDQEGLDELRYDILVVRPEIDPAKQSASMGVPHFMDPHESMREGLLLETESTHGLPPFPTDGIRIAELLYDVK